MSTQEKIIDDVARAAGGAVGLISGLAGHAKSSIRTKIDDMAQNLDLVPREDFEKMELLLTTLRLEQEVLKKRVEALETALDARTQQKA